MDATPTPTDAPTSEPQEPTPHLRSAIVFINGFHQGIGPGVGLQKLYHKTTRCWYDRRLDLVLHRTWNANHAETADLILSHRPDLIYVVGYSYGCGWGLTKLAKHLHDRGWNIDTAFLVDAVTRYRVLKPVSLGWFGRGKLWYDVPANVDEVFSWRQVNKGAAFDPVGHRVRAHPNTKVQPQIVMGSSPNLKKYARDVPTDLHRIDREVNHDTIDSHPMIHRRVLEILTRRNPPPTGYCEDVTS